jgi:ClpP class serine protease
MTKIYSMLPEAVATWERRKIEAMAKMPRAEVSRETKQAITDMMDENREFYKQYFSMMYNQRREMRVEDGIAFIHINDYLGGNLTFLDRCLGASDYADIAADIRKAASQSDVRSVLLEVDSGGGSAVGCVEVGKLVAELDAQKPVTAFTSSLCCSAAYAIAAGARERWATPSAMVGSIGTIFTWMDYAKLAEKEGITPHIVTNEQADLKAAANMFRTPTDEEMAHIQSLADEYGMQFQSFVAERVQRIDVSEGFRGQWVSGRDAVRVGFIEGTIEREELLSAMRV